MNNVLLAYRDSGYSKTSFMGSMLVMTTREHDYDFQDKGLYRHEKLSYIVGPFGTEYREIGYVTFAPFPGCCGIVVSTDLRIEGLYRGKRAVYNSVDYNRDFMELRKQAARFLGYSKMMATVQMFNIPELATLFKTGWRCTGTFTNKRTNNLLGVFEFDLTKGD